MSDDIVKEIRDRFLLDSERNSELFHQIDVNRVRTDDWQIERYVADYTTEELAYEAMVKSLKWKKEFGVHERTDQYFPREFFINSEVQMFGEDREGRKIQWEKTRQERNFTEFNPLFKQFIAHVMEKIDVECGSRGMTLVTDTNGAGLSNVNMDTFRFKIEIMNYYPGTLVNNYVVDLPWMLKGVAKMILSFCEQKLKDKIYFINRKELTSYIDPAVITTELDGLRERKQILPEGLKSIHDLPHLGLNDKLIQKYLKSYP